MKTLASWDAALASPAPRDPLVQLHTSVVATVVRFIERGLAKAEGVIAIATAAHWARISEALVLRGVDVAAALGRTQLPRPRPWPDSVSAACRIETRCTT